MAINKLIIGGSGTGKTMVTFRMNPEKYAAFSKFCIKNRFEYFVHYKNSENAFIVDCEKYIFEKFRLRWILFKNA